MEAVIERNTKKSNQLITKNQMMNISNFIARAPYDKREAHMKDTSNYLDSLVIQREQWSLHLARGNTMLYKLLTDCLFFYKNVVAYKVSEKTTCHANVAKAFKDWYDIMECNVGLDKEQILAKHKKSAEVALSIVTYVFGDEEKYKASRSRYAKAIRKLANEYKDIDKEECVVIFEEKGISELCGIVKGKKGEAKKAMEIRKDFKPNNKHTVKVKLEVSELDTIGDDFVVMLAKRNGDDTFNVQSITANKTLVDKAILNFTKHNKS